MIYIQVLASSSKGNATLISTDNTRLLIDAGISARRISTELAKCQLSPADLHAIFITHEHKDHCCGLGQLSKKFDIPIYCTRHCATQLRPMAPLARFCYLTPHETCELRDLQITPVSTHHDSVDPVGFILECNQIRVGYLTDTGHACRKLVQAYTQLDGLFIESNYDPQLLSQSGRPYSLIQRICNNWGHLSNQQTAELITQTASARLQHIILAHLSQECNTPEHASSCIQHALDELELSTQLHCAHPVHGLPRVSVSAPFTLS